LQQLKHYTAGIHQSIFEIVNKIKPQQLSTQGLLALLDSDFFAAKLALANIDYQYVEPASQITLPESLSLTLYRIIQETINNTIKYSNASTYQIDITAASEALVCTIQDNGIGFNLNDSPMGFGIQGIFNRVELLKGTCSIDTRHGTTYRIQVPLA
jgi:two-component system sensor histidine kinase UhpB